MRELAVCRQKRQPDCGCPGEAELLLLLSNRKNGIILALRRSGIRGSVAPPPLVRFAGTAGPGSSRSTTGAKVAADATNVHTSQMTLKGAALLALIGTILMTVLLAWTFVLTFLNALRGLVPAVTLFQSFIYAFGCFSVAVFLYVFHRAQ